MESARHFVSAAAKFSAGVQHGVHHFKCIFSGGVFTNWNAATIVGDSDGIIFVDAHKNARCMPGHRFVNGVVNDFVDKVMQAALIGRADVHAGTLANRFKSFKNLNAGCAVVARCLLCAATRCGYSTLLFGHSLTPLICSTSRCSSSFE